MCDCKKKLSDILFEIKTSLQSKSKILHFDRLKPYTSEIVPEITVKLKKNTESDIKNVLKLPQQGDKFSKNVTGLKTKVKVGVLRPVQQPGSYWDRSSELPLVGLEPTEVTAYD